MASIKVSTAVGDSLKKEPRRNSKNRLELCQQQQFYVLKQMMVLGDEEFGAGSVLH